VRKLPLCAAFLAMSAPAVAGYKLIPANKPVAVTKGTIKVTPPNAWNRLTLRPGRYAESWTLDGLMLNDITFYGGIGNDTTLFREVDKKSRPLPHFSSTMLVPDIAQLFEATYRVAVGTSLMSIDSIEPGIFSGTPGFRFAYSFTVQSEEVMRKGEATGAVIDGKLYMISYEAPAIHYYPKSIEAYRALVASASVTRAGTR
jgi:hypothetical protein